MSFYEIKDRDKRDEIVKEINERRKKIYQDSKNENIYDANLQTDLTKLYKPLIESNEKVLKKIAVDKVDESNLLALTYPEERSEPASESAIESPNLRMNVGKIAFYYLSNYASKKGICDRVFGIHTKEKQPGKMFIGKEELTIDDNDVIIGGESLQRYKGTIGLWELISRAKPDKTKITDEDMENYEKILVETKAMEYDENPNKPKASRSEKWQTIVSKIWEKFKSDTKVKKGNGVLILPSDPNALVERFTLSVAAWYAGNKGSRNEAVSICDELLRQNRINKEEYKSMMAYIDAKPGFHR